MERDQVHALTNFHINAVCKLMDLFRGSTQCTLTLPASSLSVRRSVAHAKHTDRTFQLCRTDCETPNCKKTAVSWYIQNRKTHAHLRRSLDAQDLVAAKPGYVCTSYQWAAITATLCQNGELMNFRRQRKSHGLHLQSPLTRNHGRPPQ